MRGAARATGIWLSLLACLWASAEPAQADDNSPAPVDSAPAGSTAGNTAALASAMERGAQELAIWAEKERGRASVTVIDVASGRLVAHANEHLALNPASNAKILTAAVALKTLGPEYRFGTGLYGTLRDGVVEDLVLRGEGDPSFDQDALAGLCRKVVGLGLRRVTGRILVDQSRFDGQFVPPAFEQQPNEWAGFRAPISAVALERNTVTLNVYPADSGVSARVWFEPAGFVQVEGAVETGKPGSGQDVRLELRPDGARLRAILSGHVAKGLPLLRFQRRVDDPSLFAGYALEKLLKDHGVVVAGRVEKGGDGRHDLLALHQSPALSAVLGELGKNSDNFFAETILKAVGSARKARPARSEDGAQAVRDWLKDVGALDPGTRFTNGSGLFDANRISSWTLARALAAASRDPAIGPDFVAQLAVGGVDGTLRSRFRKHRNTRVVRAKTGTLARVNALSGYVLGQQGQPSLAFSIVLSELGNHALNRQHIDAFVEELVKAAN